MATDHGPELVYPHSTLEPVPPSALEPAKYGWGGPSVAQFPHDQYGQRRILGLSVRAFWTIVVILVVVIAGAIGGGVGGGLAAARGGADSSISMGAGTQSSASSTASTTPTISTSTDTGSTTSSTTSTSTRPAAAAVSPAPRDDGCPSINGTAYTPVDAGGNAMPLRTGGAAQSFMRLCNTNYPSGRGFGNPDIHDILKMYLPSLEDCITACAAYNWQYQRNVEIGVPGGGLCRSVAIIKTTGEYCYLKNGTGTNNTFGRPELYSSAVLIS
ncbi:Putative membrane protein insertase [Madurella fahalii]|uniref:Membrane protein insertase n=1 Tax=Madurella fahalii TaxID=1157608 RepID=A0ABQ0FXD3_9PEZI